MLSRLDLILRLLQGRANEWQFDKKAENPDNERNNNRRAKNTTEAKEYTAKKINLVNVAPVLVKIIKHFFDHTATSTHLLIAD